MFFEKSQTRFTTVLEPLVGQIHFLPSHLRLLFKLLGSRLARRPCCALSAIAIAAHRPSNLCEQVQAKILLT